MRSQNNFLAMNLQTTSFIWLLASFLVSAYADQIGTLSISIDSGLKLTLNGYNNKTLNLNLGLVNGNPLPLKKVNGSASAYHYRSSEGNIGDVSIEKQLTPEAVDCYAVTWPNPPSQQEDCIDLMGSYWYGGGELRFQEWPINLAQPRYPYVTGDFFHHPYGGLIERIWFNSNGQSIRVDDATPLFLRFNQSGDGKMCFSASYDEYPYTKGKVPDPHTKELKYVVCSAPNVRKIVEYSLNRWVKKPRQLIDDKILNQPIWSTWAKYKAEINQSTVMEFARDVVSNGFGGSHLEIDDKWETCYGDLKFDLVKFPDPAKMIKDLKNMGFGVSFWVHPFTNKDCETFKAGAEKGYFVKNISSNEPLLATWWNGVAGYLDTTNKEAVDSMEARLRALQTQYGIDTYKFDAGELHWNDAGFSFTDSDIMKTPNDFTRLYTELASRFGTGVEVRAAYNSQEYPIFLRMLDKDSKWTYDNGLRTLIPTTLLFSVTGYPFVLPDMIGGNNYGTNSSVPDRELFIRWLQLNAFLPALQFSIVPWDYDKEMNDLTLKYVKLHQDYVPLMTRLGEDAVRTGNPIIRPLWWVDPENQNSLAIDDQFLVGDDLMVAPVVDKGVDRRDVFLPSGKWKDLMNDNGSVYVGPKWLINFRVNITQIPYFARQSN